MLTLVRGQHLLDGHLQSEVLAPVARPEAAPAQPGPAVFGREVGVVELIEAQHGSGRLDARVVRDCASEGGGRQGNGLRIATRRRQADGMLSSQVRMRAGAAVTSERVSVGRCGARACGAARSVRASQSDSQPTRAHLLVK